MSYGSPDPYGGSPAPSPAAGGYDAPSPAVSINSTTGRPLKGKGSRGPYKKRKRDSQQSSAAGPSTPSANAMGFDDFAESAGFGPADGGGGGGGGKAKSRARRDSITSVDHAAGTRSARASTPAAGPSRRGTVGPSTPAPTPGPSGQKDDEDDEDDVVDDENELARLDGGDGEGGEGEQQGEVRRRIQRVKEDQILLTEHMSAGQRDRFDAWKVASFNRQSVKRHITTTTSNTITDDMAQIIGGVAKVYIGQVMSIARKVQQERGDTGPLAPIHLREAARRMTASTAGIAGRGIGTGKKRRLFAR